MEINIPKGGIFTEGVHVPYNLGIFGLVLAYFISVRMYRRSRHYSMHGIFSFIDHDAYAMLSVIFISVLAGIMITYIWPIVIQVFLGIFTIIREDSSNPLNDFI